MASSPLPQQDLTGLGQLTALLGPGTEFSGKLAFSDRVRIEGRVEGEIMGDGTLILAEGADIRAQVSVGTLIMRGGILRGNITATTLVEIYTPAKVYGDIHTPELLMEKGVVFEGKCTMEDVRINEPAPLPDARDA
ncbi:MAG: polymer-forming cytoskeletal protein [Myxococcales bacterium]|nr:polymer-forming cytoskeletal protein [Myxococcales bacterium]